MRVKLEPEKAFIGKKFVYIFLGIIFVLNAIVFFWYFFLTQLRTNELSLINRSWNNQCWDIFYPYTQSKRKLF